VRHTWDDWDPYVLLGKSTEETMQALARISDRAMIAYATACAEWVVYRFYELSSDPLPYQFLEACWAFQMDKEIQAPPPSKDVEWKGPIRGPIDLSLVTVLNTYHTTEDGVGDIEGAFGERIALHVLSDQRPFMIWRAQVLPRLERLFSRTPMDPWGAPVPREALDPTVEVTPDHAAELARRFLMALDFQANPLLRRIEGGDNSQ
jgi:hypothetical protein